ncbi:unnamed protein product [Clonostachys chloroleuca]|uniref:Protein FMP42 n=1 Tax=Clonostachys chloroleuca TaxID=1926264 RepID=A0AA35VM99_9HYPO|nr:unnamed protein product [Clonostachys chloroleuca]
MAWWLASGILFGFAALKPVLIAKGVFYEVCDDKQTAWKPVDKGDSIPCSAQDMRLNLVFIVGSISTNLVIGSVLFATGSLLIGFSFSLAEFNSYMVGNMFLGLGFTFIFVPSFQLSHAFPKHSSIVVTVITGAFDASMSVLLFYRIAYETSGGTFPPNRFFFGYLAVPALIIPAEFCIMPSHACTRVPDVDILDSNELARVRSARSDRRHRELHQLEEITGDVVEGRNKARVEVGRQEMSGVWGVLHGLSATQQMRTPWFMLILLLTVLQMLRMNYFIATIRSQYNYMLGSATESEAINHFFDAALPIGGVLSTPLIGMVLSKLSVSAVFGILTLCIVIMGVLNCIPALWAAFATVVGFVVFRPLYYSAISDYATKVFGFATFGRIHGALICVSGLVNFAQSGLDALTHGPLRRDPTAINVVMTLVSTLIGIALTVFLVVQSKKIKNEARARA